MLSKLNSPRKKSHLRHNLLFKKYNNSHNYNYSSNHNFNLAIYLDSNNSVLLYNNKTHLAKEVVSSRHLRNQ